MVMQRCVRGEMKTRIWLCEYVQLVMSGYGHDESAPTPGGVFCGVSWVGCYIISKPLAALLQTVSSCRGRFIAPAYMKTPTK